MNRIFYLTILFLWLTSCEKEAGKGGTSTIKGSVVVWEYNKDYTIKHGEYPGQEVDVYIIYGGDEVYGDRFRTSYDGKYAFEFLREGNYTLYALSADTNNLTSNERIPVLREVKISGKNQTVVVPDIVIVE